MPLLEHHPGRALRVKGRHTWYVNIRSASQIADIFVGVVGMSAKGQKWIDALQHERINRKTASRRSQRGR